MPSAELLAALEIVADELAEAIARKVAHRLSEGTPDMVPQGKSPLGRRRHCTAVRRRLAEGMPGAAVVGRRHLLSREALNEELARLGKSDPDARPRDIADELRRELGLIRKKRLNT